MITLYYGDDRLAISNKIKQTLGDDYEVLDVSDLKIIDLPNIFLGNSLFQDQRKILLKDLQDNKDVWDKLPEYLQTEHTVVIWETKLDKRTVVYKALLAAKIKMQEYKITSDKTVFNIYDAALSDGKKAVSMVEIIKNKEDPYRFTGLLVSEAIKKYGCRFGAKEKRVLKELSKLDMKMKLTSSQQVSWSLVKSFLLRVSSL